MTDNRKWKNKRPIVINDWYRMPDGEEKQNKRRANGYFAAGTHMVSFKGHPDTVGMEIEEFYDGMDRVYENFKVQASTSTTVMSEVRIFVTFSVD